MGVLFDTDSRATSLEKFLNLANKHTAQFKQATEHKVKARVKADKAWIKSRQILIHELTIFRNQQIAHLDISSARNHFGEKTAGIAGISGPDIVEQARKMLEDVIKIVNAYSQYYNGK